MPNDNDAFQELLGEQLSFFNKDINSTDLFKLRKQALEHEDDCSCEACRKVRILEQLGLG